MKILKTTYHLFFISFLSFLIVFSLFCSVSEALLLRNAIDSVLGISDSYSGGVTARVNTENYVELENTEAEGFRGASKLSSNNRLRILHAVGELDDGSLGVFSQINGTGRNFRYHLQSNWSSFFVNQEGSNRAIASPFLSTEETKILFNLYLDEYFFDYAMYQPLVLVKIDYHSIDERGQRSRYSRTARTFEYESPFSIEMPVYENEKLFTLNLEMFFSSAYGSSSVSLYDYTFRHVFDLKITNLLNENDQRLYDYENGHFFLHSQDIGGGSNANPIPEPSTIILVSLSSFLVLTRKSFSRLNRMKNDRKTLSFKRGGALK